MIENCRSNYPTTYLGITKKSSDVCDHDSYQTHPHSKKKEVHSQRIKLNAWIDFNEISCVGSWAQSLKSLMGKFT